jgi:hypothetical protein
MSKHKNKNEFKRKWSVRILPDIFSSILYLFMYLFYNPKANYIVITSRETNKTNIYTQIKKTDNAYQTIQSVQLRHDATRICLYIRI